jgi:MYXO-CTERM domain-containing protein
VLKALTKPCVVAIGVAVALCHVVKRVDAATYNWSAAPNVDFRLWVPDERNVINGIYLDFNASNTDARAEADSTMAQAWARTLGFAILGTYYNDANATSHSADVVTALSLFATMSNHPELANGPVVAAGASLGGYNAMAFAAAYPARTIAYASVSNNTLVDTTGNDAFLRVPGLYQAGTQETWISNRPAEVMAIRQRGGLVAFYWGWGFPHGYGWDPAMGWNFLSDVARRRYPAGADPRTGPVTLIDLPEDSGWLADASGLTLAAGAMTPATPVAFTRVAPYASFGGDPRAAFWLPSADIANLYRGLASYEHPISYSAPIPNPWTATGYNNPPFNEWLQKNPGDAIDIVVTVDGQAPARVELFDGASSVGALTASPYKFTWTASGFGVHGFTVVATYADSSQKSGAIAPLIVLGAPPDGTAGIVHGSDDAGVTPAADAGAAPSGGGAAVGSSDMSRATPRPSHSSSHGCHCELASSPSSGPSRGMILTLAALAGAFVWSRRRRRERRE